MTKRRRTLLVLAGIAVVLGIGFAAAVILRPDKAVRKMRFLNAAQAFEKEGKLEEAIIEYKNLVQVDPRDMNSHLLLARAYDKAGQPDRALRHFNYVVKNIDPNNVEALLKVGEFFYQRQFFAELKDVATRLEKLNPENETPEGNQQRMAKAQLWQGVCALVEQHNDDATQRADAALSIDRTLTDAYLLKVRIAFASGDRQKVVEAYHVALERAADTKRVLIGLGMYRCNEGAKALAKQDDAEAKKQFDLGRENLRLAIELAPDGYETHTAMGTLEQAARDMDAAEKCFRRAADVAPEMPEVHVVLGDFYFYQQRPDDAEVCYRRALQLLGEKPGAFRAKVYARLTDSLVAMNRWEDAEEKLSDMEKDLKTPGSPMVSLLRGKLALAQNDPDTAARYFYEIIRTQRDKGSALGLLGRAYIQMGLLTEAQVRLDEAIKSDPNNAGLKLWMVDVLNARGEADRAEAVLVLAKQGGARPNEVVARNIRIAYTQSEAAQKRARQALAKARANFEQGKVGLATAQVVYAGDEMGCAAYQMECCVDAAKLLLTGDKENAEANTFLLNVYLQRSELEAAHGVADALLAIDPASPRALTAKALCCAASGDRAGADKHFRQAISAKTVVREQIGSFLFYYERTKRDAEAIAILEELAAEQPPRAAVLDALAGADAAAAEKVRATEGYRNKAAESVAAYNEQIGKAVETFKKLAEVRPGVRVQASILHLAVQEGDLEGAKAAVAKMVEFDRQSPITLYMQGRLACLEGKYSEAEARFREALGVEPSAAYVMEWLSIALKAQGKMAEAIEVCERALGLAPTNTNLQLFLADLYAQNGQPTEALRVTEQLVNASPDEPETGAIQRSAVLYATEGQWQQSEQRWRQLAERAPGAVYYQLQLARAAKQQGKSAEMEVCLTKVLDGLDQEHPSVIFQVVSFLNSIDRGDVAKAKLLKLAESRPKEKGTFLAMLAAHYYMVKDLPAAEAAFKQWAEAEPQGQAPLLSLGDFYRATGKLEEALAAFKKAEVLKANVQAGEATNNMLVSLGRGAEAFEHAGALGEAEFEKQPDAVEQIRCGLQLRALQLMWQKGEAAQAKELVGGPSGQKLSRRAKLTLDAAMAMYEGRVQEAIEAAQKALPGDKPFGPAHYVIGYCRFMLGDVFHAESEADEALKGVPGHTPSLLLKAEAQRMEKRYDQCVQTLRPLESNTQAQIIRAKCLINQEKYEDAEALLSTVRKAEPENTRVIEVLAAAQVAQKKLDSAEKTYLELYDAAGKTLEALEGIVGVLLSIDRARAAEAKCRAHLAEHPDQAGAYMLLADTLYAQKRSAEALEACRDGIKNVGGKVGDLVSLRLKLGGIQHADRNYDGAVEDLRAAVKLDEKRPDAQLALADALLATKAHAEEAIAGYRRVLELAPNAVSAANNLAWLLAEKGELAEAHAICRKCIDAGRTNPSLWDTYGWICYREKKLNEAEDAYQKSLREREKSATTNYHLGLVYMDKGQHPQAKEAFDRSLSIEDTGETATMVRQALASLPKE